ncbi:MAG: helix-turn-helix domain-containing protein [Ferrimicrobium sp.]
MEKQQERTTKEEPTRSVVGRPIVYHVTLSEEERENLLALIRQTTAPQAQVRRAKIALYADEGMGTGAIAKKLSLSAQTVDKWRRRFSLFGVKTLSDAPRSGAPRTHGDDKITEIIKLTTTTDPPDSPTHWSTNTMAVMASVSPSTVGRIWRTFGLKPHMVSDLYALQ